MAEQVTATQMTEKSAAATRDESSWHDLAVELIKRKDFWADSITALGYWVVGSASLAWERVTKKNGPVAMFTSESVQVVAMGQVAAIALIGLGNPKFNKTTVGRIMLTVNLYGLLLHARRIRLALQSGPLLQQALNKSGIHTMASPTIPMLLSLLVPLRSFLSKSEKANYKKMTTAYASLETIDPALHQRNQFVSKRVKMVNTIVGRGRIAQWLSMNIYEPTTPPKTPLPVLMYIHGGGWTVGDKMFACRATITYLAAKENTVVCSINYRLAPEAVFPEQLFDCKRALVWIKENIHKHGGDPSKICIAGESAGGHLTAMMALTANNPAYNPPEFSPNQDTSVRGAVDIYGVHDMLDSEQHHATMNGHIEKGKKAKLIGLLERVVFQKKIGEDTNDFFEFGSPTHILDKTLLSMTEHYTDEKHSVDLCPIMLVHGTRDSLAALDDSRAFFQRIENIRKSTKSPIKDVFCVFPGARHGFGYLPSPTSVSLALAMSSFCHHCCQDRANVAKL